MEFKFIEIKSSEGPIIKDGDKVEFYYRLALTEKELISNNLLESTYSPDIPIRLLLSKETMLLGLYKGMLGMKSGGSIRRIFIPAVLAYGNRAWRGIPENSDLVIEVCLARILNE
jgi:FKBP-type peptidyl-prolyl cis-trans isomerase